MKRRVEGAFPLLDLSGVNINVRGLFHVTKKENKMEEKILNFLKENPDVVEHWLEGGFKVKAAYKKAVREKLKQPIIFLDVDEVIQTHRAHLQGLMIDPVAVELIQRLCDLTGARIVYVSVWSQRMVDSSDAHDVHEAFGFKGMSLMHSASGTETPWRIDEVTGKGTRGVFVEKYLKDNPSIGNYVVIDDSWSDYETMLDKVVAPDGIEGFGIRDFYRAKDILVHGKVRTAEETRLPFCEPHRAVACVRNFKTHLEKYNEEAR